jgi:hypothetical protein
MTPVARAGRLAIVFQTFPQLFSRASQLPDRSNFEMSRPAVAIPEKLFFKIGEVCELAGVQAHVLR